MATGDANIACCQPLAVSPANVAVGTSAPFVVQRFAMCVPVFAALFEKRSPPRKPPTYDRNFTPSSSALLYTASGTEGVQTAGFQTEEGHAAGRVVLNEELGV